MNIKSFEIRPIQNRLVLWIFFTSLMSVLGIVISIYKWIYDPTELVFLGWIAVSLIITFLQMGLWFSLMRNVVVPLQNLSQSAKSISEGDILTTVTIESLDEIGSIAHSTHAIAQSIKQAREFTSNIGQGNFESAVLQASQKDIEKDGLFISLMKMRDQLKKVAEEDKKRNWITKGMAEFTQILRADDTNVKLLGKNIIIGLVNYLNASQGAVFMLNDFQATDIHLELVATYAYTQLYFEERKIILKDDFADGLVGQAFLENQIINLANIPDDYANISSGLGDKKPKNILIVPLQLNGKTEGVIELASFSIFQPYQIEFVERVSQNIASAILTIKTNDNTKKLLYESQQLALKLQSQEQELKDNFTILQNTQIEIEKKNQEIEAQKQKIEEALEEQTEKSEMLEAQEEEMRQNMDELLAIQEQMRITQLELDGQLNAINSSAICKVEYSLEGKIIKANSSFCQLVKCDDSEITGLSHNTFVDNKWAKSQEYKLFWENLRKGVSQAGDYLCIDWEGEEFWLNAVFSPMYDSKGKPQKIIQLAFNVTEAKNLLQETQTQASILKIQETELKEKMSQLTQAQAEINAKNQAIIELREEETRNAQQRARETESKNQLITSSINYAQSIQKAILPNEDRIKQYVQDFFVVFMPKDIVSGDFYWFVHVEQENISFFAAVDCTGHGVPGAFMSIIGNTILNEIVNGQKIYDPHKILELLHIGVRTRLRQGETTNQDGMDISLCKITPQENNEVKVTFAGAKRPLYFYENNTHELKELKGDRISIGGFQGEAYRSFTQQDITLQKGDILYLTTDGVMDNPNIHRKKFSPQKFKDVMFDNIKKTLKQQCIHLLNEIVSHQGEAEQRDDITIMGVRL